MASGQNLEHLQKVVFLCWSFYLCNHLSISIHSWTKGTLPYPTPPYPTLPYPPTTPHPTPPLPTYPYPTQHMHISKTVAVELHCHATALIADVKTKAQISCLCRAAYQRLCFSYIDSIIPPNLKLQVSSHLLLCTAWFASDLIGNPENRFFLDTAHIDKPGN